MHLEVCSRRTRDVSQRSLGLQAADDARGAGLDVTAQAAAVLGARVAQPHVEADVLRAPLHRAVHRRLALGRPELIPAAPRSGQHLHSWALHTRELLSPWFAASCYNTFKQREGAAPVILQAVDDDALLALHRVKHNLVIHPAPTANGNRGTEAAGALNFAVSDMMLHSKCCPEVPDLLLLACRHWQITDSS